MADTGWLAHVRQDEQGQWQRHELMDHLRGTADLARGFADAFGSGEWAWLAGMLHDTGKFSEAFQNMIRIKSGYDPEAHLERQKGRVNHSTAGAILAVERLEQWGLIPAYLVAGHHAGLADWTDHERTRAGLERRLLQKEHLAAAFDFGAPEDLCPLKAPPLPSWIDPRRVDPNLWIRLLFSCLVDADFLDTEAFMDPGRTAQRGSYPSLEEMRPRLEEHLKELTAKAPETEVNRIRKEVLDQCLKRAADPPGLFSLTVPTGGGKTLSSLAFALQHAVANGLDRIIYVIPYTSIIEQTAGVFRDIFGEAVIEHHSSLEPSKETHTNRLASENWDGPLIVTTSVQFFESLFAAKPSRCRKLHNIVGSVVILDEAQLLPPNMLRPIIHVLDQLRSHYRVSPVLCTATQPALDGLGHVDPRLKGLAGHQEIVESPGGLHQRLKRVSVELPPDFNASTDWGRVAKELLAQDRVLAVVNTRAQARELFDLLPREGSFHLSAQMCGQHRSDMIQEIRDRLEAGEVCRVVSTQLIECGVDLDFPVVFRALAGLDSIAQAAGRCNREGRLESGRVEVFIPPGNPPPGHLAQAAGTAKGILMDRPKDPLAPENFKEYFNNLYWAKGPEGLDEEKIMEDMGDQNLHFFFRRVAGKFRMIQDQARSTVVVDYGLGRELIEELREDGPNRGLLRRCQRYVVDIPKHIAKEMESRSELKDVRGILVQNDDQVYDPALGLVTGGPKGEALFV